MINRTLEQITPFSVKYLEGMLGYSGTTIKDIMRAEAADEFEMLPYFIVKKMIKQGLLREIESWK